MCTNPGTENVRLVQALDFSYPRAAAVARMAISQHGEGVSLKSLACVSRHVLPWNDGEHQKTLLTNSRVCDEREMPRCQSRCINAFRFIAIFQPNESSPSSHNPIPSDHRRHPPLVSQSQPRSLTSTLPRQFSRSDLVLCRQLCCSYSAP